MKKMLLIFALLTLFAGCATTTPANTYPQLTAENVQSACKATETWRLRVMPMPLAVVRFATGCGGIKDLLLFVSPSKEFTKEQRRLSVELALSHYMSYLEREHTIEGKKWYAKQIKLEFGESQNFYYYKVTSK